MESLAQRAALLRESLHKSQRVTDAVVSILGSFDSRLSALDSAMRPIQVRTHAVRTAHENIDRTLRSADVILTQFDRTREAEREIQKGARENLQGFLDAVDRLRSIERFFSSNRSYRSSDGVLNHVNALLSKALVKMEGEFQNQLTQRSKPMEPDRLFDCLPSTLRPSSESQPEGGKNPSTGSQSENQQNSEAAVYSPPTLIEPKFVPLLSKLAQQLVQAGCQQQCSEIYSEARASALESSLKNLGVEKLSKEEVQKMPWEILESKIGNWIHFMRIAVKLLFAGERQLCDQVFECSQSLRDKCFAAITKNSLATLLSFGEAIAMSKRSPEKLFVLLDMYEIMCELQTEIDTIFVGESCSQMRDAALSLTKCLAQTAQKTFSDFEEAVEKDATKNIHTDGTVHPLTSYVINYVKFLFDYQSTLKQLFQEFKKEDGTGSELAAVTMKIMQALQNNLDAKAKQYKDPALMHIFLMNNIHYIVKSVRRSEAKDLLGDDWIQRHRRIVQQNANQYRRIAWSKVLQCLSGQGLTSSGGSGQVGSEGGNSSGASRAAVKERFRSFNVLFEEIYQKQCSWSVPDTELRESLRLAVAEILLPAYRSFIKRFGPLIENSKAPGKYVKHTPEQLELLLGNLFEGKQERARTYDACRVHDNVRRSLKAVDPIIRRLDLVQEADSVVLNRPSKDLVAYLHAVDKLRSVEFFFNSKRSYRTSDSVLKHVDGLLSKAAVGLENEFHRLLSRCSKPVELECLFNSLPNLSQRVSSENIFGGIINSSSKDSSVGQINVHAAYTLPMLIDSHCIPLLSKLVEKSVQLGHHQQFLKIYRDVRGTNLELNIKSLGVEYVTAEEMQIMQAETLDAEIAQWIQFYRIEVKLLFAAERKLCDQIFEGKHALKDHCFAQLTAKSLSILLSFGDAVAKSQGSPEKVFVLLDMYEATLELQSDIEMVFEGHACSENRKSALGLTKRLAQTAERTFSNFKGNILRDSPNSTTADGAVHRLTSYVTNYVKFLFDYQSSLKQIFKTHVTEDGTNSDLVSQIVDVVHALETNLEAKSKQYEDHCLAHLFLMNNIQYIIRSICRSEVKEFFADDWIQRRRRIVQQHATQYRRISWGKALDFLSVKGITSSLSSTVESTEGSMPTIGSNSSTTSKSVVKERFRSFTMQFEEVCQTQRNWVVPDRELRDNLILAIAEIIIPAYREFLKRFGPLVGSSRNPSKYIKYNPDEVEEALGNLFAKKLLIE